jgi:hypothetical protein
MVFSGLGGPPKLIRWLSHIHLQQQSLRHGQSAPISNERVSVTVTVSVDLLQLTVIGTVIFVSEVAAERVTGRSR